MGRRLSERRAERMAAVEQAMIESTLDNKARKLGQPLPSANKVRDLPEPEKKSKKAPKSK